MTRWNLTISDETDRMVRSHLARRGYKKGDLSKFVEETVSTAIMTKTLEEVQERNKDLSEAEAMKLANEAIAWSRATPA
ncbi:MAG: ribbon-helix-helix domain-containing protein [Planctomycetota bacterium]